MAVLLAWDGALLSGANVAAPIETRDGRTFHTLRDVADYVLALPARHQANPHWVYAVEAMMVAAQPKATRAALVEAERLIIIGLQWEGVVKW